MSYRFHSPKVITARLGCSRAISLKIREIVKSRFAPVAKLKTIDKIIGTYGTEVICAEEGYKLRGHPNQGGAWLYYCNTGETYKDTACYDPVNDRFFIESWGSWYEREVYREEWHKKLDG